MFPVCLQVSQMAVSAVVCKSVGSDTLLAYDSRINCLSAEYTSYRVYAWIMVGLWPLGCPVLLFLLLRSYNVPEIASRKFREAEIRAFVLNSLAKASEIGAEIPETVSVAQSCAGAVTSVPPNRSRRVSATHSQRLPIGRRHSVLARSGEGQVVAMQPYANLEDMSLPMLELLATVHGIDATSAMLPTKQLAKRMKELIDSEEVVVPIVVWNESADDPQERLAFTRLESLIGAYEVRWWWFELFEFVRKLVLIGVLTAVAPSSQAYLNVAHAVSFFSILVFSQCRPFVEPRLDRCVDIADCGDSLTR
jgi:hypothetical protein